MDEQKRPRAWVYARIPGDYDGTMNSYKVAEKIGCPSSKRTARENLMTSG